MGTSGRAFALALLGGAATYGLWYFFTLSRDRRERRQRQRRHSGGLSPTAAALVRLGSSASGPTSPAGNQRSVQVGTTDDEDENNDDENEDEGKVVQVNESGELLGALYDIAEEMARRDGYIHRSITCNHCNTSPVRGVRFKCANCSDFDLCAQCEGLEIHDRSHVFVKIRIPVPPLANPRYPVAPMFYPGGTFDKHSSKEIDWVGLTKETHFDYFELQGLFDQFRSLCSKTSTGPNFGITKATFETCLGPVAAEKNLVLDRIYAFFDQDTDDLISFTEFVKGLSVLAKGNFDERVYYAFRGYDLNGDGQISRAELRRMYKAYFHLSMELVRDVVKTMEDGLLENFDEQDAKPTSAAFSAPIVSSGPPVESQLEQPEEELTENVPTILAKLDTLSVPPSAPSSPTMLHGQILYHEDFPVMEAMSQQALDEMVNQTFADAGAQWRDEIDFSGFCIAAEKDPNLLSWFEALGCVF